VLRIDARKTQHDRARPQVFQFGLALADHTKTGDASELVTWSSRTPAIPATVQMLPVPAAAELPRELQLINRASGWPFSNPNSVALIRAVNALQRLGKAKALATLEKYVKLTDTFGYIDDQEVVFWIIRVLFEPIRLDDRIPNPAIAVCLVDRDSADAANWPLDPMAVVDDIPFMVGERIGGSGMPEPPSAHVEWARRHGVVRDEPLKPTTNPILVAEAILRSQRFKQLADDLRGQARHLIRSQALAMLDGIVPPTATKHDNDATKEQQWNALVER